MNYDPMKFLSKLCSIKYRILAHGINAYKQVAGNHWLFGVVKSDNISKIVMAQILQIDVEYVRVGAENDVDIAKTAYFTLRYQLKPTVVEQLVFVLELNILKKVPDHRFDFKLCKSTTKIGIEIYNFYL